MRVAILGGKSLLDIVLLNKLSKELPNLDIECYGDSGEISFGSRRLFVRNIESLNVDKFNIILNLSNNYSFVLEHVKVHNDNARSKIIYLNKIEGELVLSFLKKPIQKLALIPDFGVEAICRSFLLIKDIKKMVNIVINQPIAELGKEAMNRFHYENKESAIRVIQQNEETQGDALAFNISYSYPENQNPIEFKDSFEEEIIKKQIQKVIDVPMIINTARVPVNKGASAVITFEGNEKTELSSLKKKFEGAGFLYARYGFSTILVENDSSIYITKLKKQGNIFSFTLIYDSIQIYVENVVDAIIGIVEKLD